ncbi:MAG: [FeFe] hydrogenase H-cluster maturation GTPase HydF [Lachnospiraceae bacterium]|nr:[FeFe] hydrogenase H-cluster maturation GTPase HydF [Lachnospiraceae bacterium]
MKNDNLERTHIAFFGRRNVGKSSLVNAFTGQDLSIVSDVKGTTTDPVRKTMELLPLGPVVIIDTPGIDDEGELGMQRVQRTQRILDETDIAVLVVENEKTAVDVELIKVFKERKIPYILAYNKSDINYRQFKSEIYSISGESKKGEPIGVEGLQVSAKTGEGIHELKETCANIISQRINRPLIFDLVNAGDVIILVVPIDSAAPKGRLILPQQMVLRDALDCGAIPITVKESELPRALDMVNVKPKLVITDSQVFAKVNEIVPKDILLTSFSIIMARFKGNLTQAVEAARCIDTLKDGDKVLISEGCTHHRQCGDIGSVKLPALINKYAGKKVDVELSSGREFPTDLQRYKMVIHCGGCMLGESEMQSRYKKAAAADVPMSNYGIAIAHMNGILDRTLEVFER